MLRNLPTIIGEHANACENEAEDVADGTAKSEERELLLLLRWDWVHVNDKVAVDLNN